MMNVERQDPAGKAQPKCVVLLYQKMWAFLYDRMIPRMSRDYGTKFIIVSPADAISHLKANVIGPDDEIVDMEELERTGEPSDHFAVKQEAARNELRYNVSYMRDLAQQIRNVSANYFAYAPVGNFSYTKVRPWTLTIHALNSMFCRFEELLSSRGVDLVISRPDISISTLVCVYVAAAKGIPITFGKGARYKDYISWACGPYAEGDLLKKTYNLLEDCPPAPREEVVAPGGSNTLWKRAKSRYSLMKTAKAIIIETIVHGIFVLKDIRKGALMTANRLSYIGAVRLHVHAYRVARWLDAHGNKDIESIASEPYVLFLLPQEPEFSVQSLCREFPHTFTVVQQLAMCLPPDTRLVIKEHSVLTGRRLSFYKDLLRFPNVVLAHRMLEGVHLADRSAAVATMSGTTGLEATLLGKQVVLVGRHVEYGFLPNVHRVEKFDDLPRLLKEALRQRTATETDGVRRAGSKFRAAVAATSFSAPGTPPLWGTRQQLTDDELAQAIQTLCQNMQFQQQMALRCASGTTQSKFVESPET